MSKVDLYKLSSDKQTLALLRQLQKQGRWDISPTGGGHIQLRHKETGKKVHMSSTPSDHRALANTKARIARIDRGRSDKILEFMQDHPNEGFRPEYVAKTLFNQEYKADKEKTRQNVSQTLLRMSEKYDKLDRPKKGTYIWVEQVIEPEPQPQPQPEPEHITWARTLGPSVTTDTPSDTGRELFEEVKRLVDGRLVLEDSSGKLYVAIELHVPKLLEE